MRANRSGLRLRTRPENRAAGSAALNGLVEEALLRGSHHHVEDNQIRLGLLQPVHPFDTIHRIEDFIAFVL